MAGFVKSGLLDFATFTVGTPVTLNFGAVGSNAAGGATGDTLCIGIYWIDNGGTGTITTITDNINGAWTIPAGGTAVSSTVRGAVAYFLGTGSSASMTISISFNANVNTVCAAAHQITGYPIFDAGIAVCASTFSAGTDNLDQSGASGLTLTGADYVFGFACNSNGIGPLAGTGFTQRVNNNGGGYESSEDLIASGAGTQHVTFSCGAGTTHNGGGALAFKPSGGASDTLSAQIWM